MIEIEVPAAEHIMVTEGNLSVDLSDGRAISVPLAWYRRFVYASQSEKNNWRLIGKGYGIHWEDLDEDISIEGLLAGKPSDESQTSFRKWLETRVSQPAYTIVSARVSQNCGRVPTYANEPDHGARQD